MFYALLIDFPEDKFWELDPKSLQFYFRVYKRKRQTAIQDIWLQGNYFRMAIVSAISFSDKKPPEYPPMPTFEEENLSKEELGRRVFERYRQILSKHKER
nr:MAG TPA: hypothetical protein [Caudoviricetes sp.]